MSEVIKVRCSKTTKYIADKILALRRGHGLTQEKFAEKVGLDTRTVQRIEKGEHRASAETMEAIALAFNIPVRYFFDNSVYELEDNKSKLIEEIVAELKLMSVENIHTVKRFVKILS